MISILMLAATLPAAGPADFEAAFPGASVIESPTRGRLTSASGFEAAGLGETPEAAARAFLAKYGPAFGINPPQELVARNTLMSGHPGPVRFERRIDGSPVFDGDVVVGVNASNAVILVNSTDVPGQVEGRARISRAVAIRAAKRAIPRLEMSDSPRAERGWRAAGQAIRPVWRVDFTAARPPGDWRTYVDAETGKVHLRVDLRTNARGLGVAPHRGGLERPVPRP
jgi:Zn-dependent metalloprotease